MAADDKGLGFVKVLVGMLVAVISAAAAAGGTISLSKEKLETAVKDIAELKAKQEPDAVWKQHVEDHFQNVDQSLDRIERKLGTK